MKLQAFSENHQLQFWTLNIFGWLGYSSFVLLSGLLVKKTDEVQYSYTIMAACSGILSSMLLRFCIQRVWHMDPLKRGLFALMAVGLATGLWSWLKMDLYFWMYVQVEDGHEKSRLAEYLGWYTYSFFILLSWAALYQGIKYYQLSQEQNSKILKATAMAHQAQLKMLRYQLNPHFLFNTLNAISTLVLDKENEVANTMVMRLSGFLRYSLDNDPVQKISLAKEIEALNLYLGIEKIRFEERLKLEFVIEDKANKGLIPSLLLQPLVENSIKYAIAKSESGGTIRLEAKVFADELLLVLSDNGPGIVFEDAKLPNFTGVGINNMRGRLKEVYGEAHSCSFSSADPHGLKITIRIPFEEKPQ